MGRNRRRGRGKQGGGGAGDADQAEQQQQQQQQQQPPKQQQQQQQAPKQQQQQQQQQQQGGGNSGGGGGKNKNKKNKNKNRGDAGDKGPGPEKADDRTLYEILGVPQDATPNAIRSAYRKGAMAHHPDKGGDAETFKEISHAYQVLSDERKREAYDMGGMRPMYGDDDPDYYPEHFAQSFADFMSTMFGPSLDVEVEYEIPLETVLTGKTIKVSYERLTVNDSGHARPSNHSVELSIPPGITHRSILESRNNGHVKKRAGKVQRRGDLFVRVSVAEHPVFRRSGADVIVTKSIGIYDALCGCAFNVTGLDKKPLRVTVAPGEVIGHVDLGRAIEGYGLPESSDPSLRGDLIIHFEIDLPASIPADSVAALRPLLEKYRKINEEPEEGAEEVDTIEVDIDNYEDITDSEDDDDYDDYDDYDMYDDGYDDMYDDMYDDYDSPPPECRQQ